MSGASPAETTALRELVFGLVEKHHGVADLHVPADCSHDDICKAAEKDELEVDHGGNHDTVKDPEGHVVTQIPRHAHLNPNTCRSIVKALRAAVGEMTERAAEKASDADTIAALKSEIDATLKDYVGYEIEGQTDSEVPYTVNGRDGGTVRWKQPFTTKLTGFEVDPTTDEEGTFYCDWYYQWETDFADLDSYDTGDLESQISDDTGDEDYGYSGRKLVRGRGPYDDDVEFGDPEPEVREDELPADKDVLPLAKEIRDAVQKTVYDVLKRMGRRSRKMKVTAGASYVTVDVPLSP